MEQVEQPEQAEQAEQGEGTDDRPLATEIAAMRLVGLVASFGAAYLAGRLSGRTGTAVDRTVRDSAVHIATPPVQAVANAITPPAFPLIYMPAALLIGGTLMRQGNPAARSVPAAALLAFVSYHTLKRVTQRNRPPSKIGARNYSHSYPSGHTAAATAISVATANALRKGNTETPLGLLALIAVGVPVLVGASRVALDEHWLTDVVGGWAVGTAVAGAASSAALVEE